MQDNFPFSFRFSKNFFIFRRLTNSTPSNKNIISHAQIKDKPFLLSFKRKYAKTGVFYHFLRIFAPFCHFFRCCLRCVLSSMTTRAFARLPTRAPPPSYRRGWNNAKTSRQARFVQARTPFALRFRIPPKRDIPRA